MTAPPPPDLSVLIVTYNSAGFIGACIDALRRTVTGHSFEVVVADNASTDGIVPLIRARYPELRVIEMGANTGFARACNRAIAESSGRHVLLLNGDTEVLPGAVDALVAFLDGDPARGVAAPRLLNTDRTDQGTARAFPTPAAALLGRRSPLTRAFPRNRWSRRFLTGLEHQGREPFRVDWVSGACMAVPRAVVDRVGGLDERFFMHFEDADWCRRIGDAGYQVHCVPEAEVVHHEGGSRRGWPLDQVVHFHYGAYRYYVKHHVRMRWSPRRPLVAAMLGARAVAVLASTAGRQRPAPLVIDRPAA